MKPRFKTLSILAAFAAVVFFLLLLALQLSPAPKPLADLQAMVVEKGWCSVSAGGDEYHIEADIAKIDDDALILTRTATSGDNSMVLFRGNSASPTLAKSVTIRFVKDPRDILELSLHDAKHGEIKMDGTLTIKLNCRRSLREWFEYLCWKAKNSLK